MSDQPRYPSYPGDEPGQDDHGQAPGHDAGQVPPPDHGQAPPPGYGQVPPPAYGQAPPSYGQVPPPGYGQAPPSYGQPPEHGFNPPPTYGYAYPQQGYGYQPRPATSTKAVVGLVLGIVSILFCYVGLVIGPIAIVLSVMARNEIDRAPHGTVEGRGMAVAGLVTGIIGTLIWAAVIALIVVMSVQ
jgi:hypothetical protein